MSLTLSPCHALTTCTAASPPAISQVDPNNSQARPFPKQVLHTLSHRCQRTTIIEQYTLRFVSSYLQRDRVTQRRFECVYRSAFLLPCCDSFPLSAPRGGRFVRLNGGKFCMEWSYFFFSYSHLDTSKYRPWKQFLVSSTRFPLHRRDYLHVHISGRRATI